MTSLAAMVSTGFHVASYDVIHNNGSTRRIATPPEEDRVAATRNVQNLVKIEAYFEV